MLVSEKLIDSRDPLIPFHRSSKHKLSHKFSLFPHTNCMKTSNLAVCKDPIAIHRCIHSQCVIIPLVYNCFVLPWQLIIANVYPHALCLAGLQCFPFSFLSIAETVSIGSKPSVGVVSPYKPKVASSVGRGRPVAPRGRGSIPMWSEFPVRGVKKSPRCARRKA